MNKVSTFFRETMLGRFLIPLGVILIALSIFIFVSDEKTKNYIKTDAVVSKVELFEEAYYDGDEHHDATYTVYVKYTVEDRTYNEEFGIFSNYKVGDKVTVAYNPSKPNEIVQPGTIIIPIVLLIGGIASLIGGIISVVFAVKKHKTLIEQEKGWKNEN